MQRWIEWGLGLAVLAGTVGGCASGDAAETVSGNEDEVAHVERGNLDIRVEASGQVEPILVVEVKSKASGEITSLHVDTGDRVEKGALLAEIDPRDVRNGLDQAQADLDVAQARFQIAQSQAKRSKELRDANVLTQQEMETTVLDAANARAQLVKAETNLQLAKERMGDVTIRAPITGTIIQKDVEAGQIIASASGNVSGGSTLMLMADLSTMNVRTLVDETDIGKVQPGQVARVEVEAYPTRTFTGAVLKIEPQAVVDQNVTMFPVLVRLDNREGLLKPNMNAEVQVEVAQRDSVLLVPNSAVVSMQDAAAAGQVLGISESELREMMARRPSQDAAAAPSGGERPRQAAAVAGTDGQARQGMAAQAGQAEVSAPAAEGGKPDCEALMAKARADRSSLTEAERVQVRQCFQAMGGMRGGPGGGPGADRGSGETRRGVLFVQTPKGPEARMVLLGLNDWDKSEVVSGVKEGDAVVLISVARLRQQQEDMMNRIRERSSPIPGGGGGGRR